jgi:hypothetical protein
MIGANEIPLIKITVFWYVTLWSLVAFRNFSEQSAVYIEVEDG